MRNVWCVVNAKRVHFNVERSGCKCRTRSGCNVVMPKVGAEVYCKEYASFPLNSRFCVM